ncbi:MULTISPECIES: hypothetical protein [unclassified Bradyrhizobium]
MTRETAFREALHAVTPDLIADLYLYPVEAGGRTGPVRLGWGCPCTKDRSVDEGWDGYPLLERAMMPGERRRLGFVFLCREEAAQALGATDRFYLWEGRWIGEAAVVR